MKIKKDKLFKFFLAGFINTVFGYFIGIITYKILYEILGIIWVGIISNVFAIFFSFLNYKFFVFKTKMDYFLSEATKSFAVYALIFIISIILLYIFIELLGMNIYIAQAFVVLSSVVISIFSQFLIVFNKK